MTKSLKFEDGDSVLLMFGGLNTKFKLVSFLKDFLVYGGWVVGGCSNKDIALCIHHALQSWKITSLPPAKPIIFILHRGINIVLFYFKTSLSSDPQIATLREFLAFLLEILIYLQSCVSLSDTSELSH